MHIHIGVALYLCGDASGIIPCILAFYVCMYVYMYMYMYLYINVYMVELCANNRDFNLHLHVFVRIATLRRHGTRYTIISNKLQGNDTFPKQCALKKKKQVCLIPC